MLLLCKSRDVRDVWVTPECLTTHLALRQRVQFPPLMSYYFRLVPPVCYFRLVFRQCPRFLQKPHFPPSAVRILHLYLARLPPFLYEETCSSNFAAVPDAFGQEDAFVGPVLENILFENKQADQSSFKNNQKEILMHKSDKKVNPKMIFTSVLFPSFTKIKAPD